MGSLDLGALNNLYDETQYFWFESSAQPWGAGAHVTLYPQSEFTTSTHANYLKGQNILINTDGISIRNGLLPMMTLDNDSLDFNVVDTTNGTYTNVASFGETIRIGQQGQSRLELSNSQFDFTFDDRYDAFHIQRTNMTSVFLYDYNAHLFTNSDLEDWVENPIVFTNSSVALANTNYNYSRTITVYCNFALMPYVVTFTAGVTSTVTLGNVTLTYTYISPTQCSFTLGGNVDLSEDYYIYKISYPLVGYGADVDIIGSVAISGYCTINGSVVLQSVSSGHALVTDADEGEWTWDVLSDGTIICHGELTWWDVTCTTSAGGGYRSGNITATLPSGVFTTIDSCQVTMKGSGGSGYTMALRSLCTPTTFTQMFWNTTSVVKDKVTVDVLIIGT